MKTLRLWLLVLLAVLIPIRGAVAAAMLCPPTGSGGHTQGVAIQPNPAGTAQEAANKHDHAHDPMQQHHGHGGHHDQQTPSNSADECNLCAAVCSVTLMLSSLPTVDMPRQVGAVTFPDLTALAPSFVSGGQDRPPRTF